MYAISQNPFVFKNGHKAGAIGESIHEKKREIEWKPGPNCPKPPPCHDLTGALEVSLEHTIKVSVPTVNNDFGFSETIVWIGGSVKTDGCGVPFHHSGEKRGHLTLERFLDPVLMQVVNSGKAESIDGGVTTTLPLGETPFYSLDGDTAQYFDKFSLVNNFEEKFDKKALMEYGMNWAIVPLVRPPIGATGFASAKLRVHVDGMDLVDVQE